MERIYGIQHGGDHGNQYTEAKPNNSDLPKSQSDLAAQMGISVDTLQNYKLLSDMIPKVLDSLNQEQLDILSSTGNHIIIGKETTNMKNKERKTIVIFTASKARELLRAGF